MQFIQADDEIGLMFWLYLFVSVALLVFAVVSLFNKNNITSMLLSILLLILGMLSLMVIKNEFQSFNKVNLVAGFSLIFGFFGVIFNSLYITKWLLI